jgi:predicted chitinase
VLNYGINAAGICRNCQAKAAFLAIAATMTDNFQNDETIDTEARFAADDAKYGNTRPGDGSRYRRRGFFGLRGRRMYARLQTLIPQYQSLNNPESVALQRNSIDIAVRLWNTPDLLNGMLKA